MSQEMIKNPKHYHVIDGVESIQIIASSMSVEQFKGFCLGNIIKYRLRAGKKADKLEQDIGKADEYVAIFDRWSHLCTDYVTHSLGADEAYFRHPQEVTTGLTEDDLK